MYYEGTKPESSLAEFVGKNIKKVIATPIIILIGIILFFSFSVKVKPSEVVIIVDLYGSDSGVQVQTLGTGRKFYNSVTHDIYKYPAYVQNHKFNNVTFKDSDGLSLSIDITVDYKFNPDKIPEIYETYRKNADEIKENYFDKWLKDSVITTVSGKYTAEKLYSDSDEGITLFKADVLTSLRERFEVEGIDVRDIYLDNLEIPEQVKDQIQLKIEATQIAQRKERELQATEADNAKLISIEESKAKGRIIEASSRAEANRILNESLNSNTLRHKELELQKEAIAKWDGQLPTVSSDGSGLILDIGSLK